MVREIAYVCFIMSIAITIVCKACDNHESACHKINLCLGIPFFRSSTVMEVPKLSGLAKYLGIVTVFVRHIVAGRINFIPFFFHSSVRNSEILLVH